MKNITIGSGTDPKTDRNLEAWMHKLAYPPIYDYERCWQKRAISSGKVSHDRWKEIF